MAKNKDKPQSVRSGTKHRSYKSKGLCDRAASLSLSGKSNKAISRELGVKPNTVANMLDNSELLDNYRGQLMKRVPDGLKNVDALLKGKFDIGDGEPLRARGTMWLLEACQVAVKKEERDVMQRDDRLAGRSREEKLFYVQHGRWPEKPELDASKLLANAPKVKPNGRGTTTT